MRLNDQPLNEGSSTEPALQAVGLTKRYGRHTVVDDVSFAVHPGSITAFLGPNGAGKSTTLRILLGLADATTGDAFVFGQRYRNLTEPARRVGSVLESNDFHPTRSGRGHLRALAALGGIDVDRVDRVLALAGLTEAADRTVRTYSLGMRQRLGLAGALLGEPDVLILDEPANGLDPGGVQWLRATLRAFADNGGSVLVSSHLLTELAHSVDHVLIIDRGRIVVDDPLDTLTSNGGTLEDVYLAHTTPVGA